LRRIGLAVVLIACSCAPYAALAQRQAPAVIGFSAAGRLANLHLSSKHSGKV